MKRIGKWLFRLLVFVLVLLLLGFVFQSCSERRDLAQFPMRGSLFDIGTHQLHLHCVGEGTPTVLLEAGLGNMVLSWVEVQPRLAEETRVCAYDRAGYGHSEPGPFPRSGAQIVDELDRLVDAAELSPPFVLVGHSNGALYARLYERMRPESVAGLVMVDPNPENAPECMELPPTIRNVYGALVALSDFGVPRVVLPFLFPIPADVKPETGEEFAALRPRGQFLSALLSETDETCDLLATTREAGMTASGLPVRLLSAEREDGHDVTRQHREWAEAIPGAEFSVVEGSGHWIQRDNPDAVIETVMSIVESARSSER